MRFIEKLKTPTAFVVVSLALILVAIGFISYYYYWLRQPPNVELGAGALVGGAGPGAEALIAVVASSAEEGEAEREVTAYLCHGAETSEWFEGEARNKLHITSEGRAVLEGILTAESAIGTIALDDNTSIAFAASPAYGVSGIYSVDVSSDGGFIGASETGGRIEGQIAKEANAEDEHSVTATLTSPEDQTVALNPDNVVAKGFSAGGARFIVSETRMVGFSERHLDNNLEITSIGCICADSSGRCVKCTTALSEEDGADTTHGR